MYAGGTYYLNTSLTIGNAGGVVNANLYNDSLAAPLVRVNYPMRRDRIITFVQYNNIPFGQRQADGCATPINDSVEISYLHLPLYRTIQIQLV